MSASSLPARTLRGGMIAAFVSILLVVAQLLVPSASFAATPAVSGRIIDYNDASLGVAGVKVVALQRGATSASPLNEIAQVVSGAGGYFSFAQLPDGHYTLLADPSGLATAYESRLLGEVDSLSSAEWFDITANGATQANKDITIFARTILSGTVTGIDAMGTEAPLENIGVFAYGYPRPEGEAPTFVGATDAAGHYSVAVPPGEYQLKFDASLPGYQGIVGPYVSEWWEDQVFQQQSEKFSVGSGQAKTLDAQLNLGGSISGVISVAAPATGLASAWVDVYEDTASVDEFAPYRRVWANKNDGSYSVVGLPDGAYWLKFSAVEEVPAPQTPLFAKPGVEWWEDQPTVSTVEPIFISGSPDYTNIDAEIQTRASLSGVISGDGVAPAGEVAVKLYTAAGVLVDSITADEDSNVSSYAFENLIPGGYKLEFSAESAGYRATWSGGGASQATATAVALEAGDAATANVTLLKAPRVILGSTPVLDGKPLVGQLVKARTGSWSPDPVELSYQWKRNGAVISGATQYYYKLSAADAGRKITVTVTGSRAGYPSVVKTSAAKSVLGVLTKTPAPTISGKANVGRTLTVKPGVWAPSGVKLSYQWKRNGVAIPKATKPSYKLVKADKGRKITVTVTGSKLGYLKVSRTSDSKKIR